MLDLSDIHHLPALADAVEQLVAEPAGLALIAGLDLPAGRDARRSTAPAFWPRVPLPHDCRAGCWHTRPRRVVIIASTRDMLRVRREERRRVERGRCKRGRGGARPAAGAVRRAT